MISMRSILGAIPGWLISLPFSFFVSGYISHYYPAWSLPFITLFILTLLGTLGVLMLREAPRVFSSTISLLTVFLAFVFALAMIALCLQYPNLFDRMLFLPGRAGWKWFVALAMFALILIGWGRHMLDKHGIPDSWQESRLAIFMQDNLPGILTSFAFFLAYLSLAHVFNRPGLDLTENFFAADNFAWINRLTSSTGSAEMRAVHPFAYFILTPIAWAFALFFNGDRLAATFLLIPLMGALCVLLTWSFVNKWTGSRAYALLIACILGASTSHLLFGSIVESYIFSAAVLLLFFVLLSHENTSLPALVAVGVLTFGITITNFIQTFIGFLVARPRLKTIFMYGLLVSVASIALTLLHAAVYPSALMFFIPSDAGVESEYSIPIFDQPAWRLIGRAILLVRNIFLYSIVAPQPFVLTEEVGGYFPRFNFFKISPGAFSYSGYDGLGQALAAVWILFVLAAVLAFAWNLFRTRKADLRLAFLLCILFNFVLHMGYGFEPFLYSANWTYALVLFTGISLSEYAERKWLQIALLVFLALLMINQWRFLQLILETISPFLS